MEEVAQNSSKQGLVFNKEKFNLMEMMFSMDKGGCTVAQEKLETERQAQSSGEKGINRHGRDPEEAGMQDKTNATRTNLEPDTSAAATNLSEHDTSRTGQAPWQEGVLDRLGQELTPQEYNMYVVHHGRMLLAFGQIEACTPREKDFVYGSLEPIPVQTVRTFKVMISKYCYVFLPMFEKKCGVILLFVFYPCCSQCSIIHAPEI